MLFNSLEYALFVPFIFILYWFCTNNKVKYQNIIILLASYFFYGYWDYRFLFLLVFSTFLDFYSGLKIAEAPNDKIKKAWLYASIIINLGFLGFFKYYNFFIDSFVTLLHHIGFQPHITLLNILLPVGISFYTFHGISYVLDIYNDRIKPTHNVVNYSVFVSFFPLLVAGPIERATHLLPQVENDRVFDYNKAVDGLKQILWGLVKKILIADGCAEHVNTIFIQPDNHTGSTLLIGAFLFAIQIYCDFSGYSDIALGTARLFGFELIRNFAYPYFSRDIAEFWRRWHISLSSWFRDYLYIPLGGNSGGKGMRIRNTFIIFIVSGFWHGANWTFIVWGALNALYFLPLLLQDQNRKHMDIVAQGKQLPSLSDLFHIGTTFLLTMFAWVFFRAESVTHAFSYLSHLFSMSLLQKPDVFPLGILVRIAAFILIEWQGREYSYPIASLGKNWPTLVRWGFYYVLIIAMWLWAGKEQQFIYFQF